MRSRRTTPVLWPSGWLDLMVCSVTPASLSRQEQRFIWRKSGPRVNMSWPSQLQHLRRRSGTSWNVDQGNLEDFWFWFKHFLARIKLHFIIARSLATKFRQILSNFRLFVYPISPEIITYNLAASLALFEPVLTQGVSKTFADINRDFLASFVGINMEPRMEAPDFLDIPREMIKNGDTFNIMRLDGLDPMIAWAMGAATGHTGRYVSREIYELWDTRAVNLTTLLKLYNCKVWSDF